MGEAVGRAVPGIIRTMQRVLAVVLAGWLGSAGACGSGGGTGAPDAGLPDSGVGADAAVLPGIADRLREIDGLTIVGDVTPVPQGYRGFALTIDQPEDHAAPGGRHFAQRLVLLHRVADGDGAPVVVYTTGYGLPETLGGRAEPTQLIAANQIAVEHRFFTPSRPEPPDWSKLTIQESADDWHAVIGVFKRVYPYSRFITTGSSKGGMTSIFHRRFYPSDVDGTVAYVAPISFGAPDDRYVAFLQQTGLPDCRQKLAVFQRAVLTRRTAMLTRMGQNGLSYTILGADKALEHAALEFPFVFWQYDSPTACSGIPDDTASDDTLYRFLDTGIAGAGFLADFSDDDILHFEPYYYQAAVQLGYPRIDESNVTDLLEYPGTDVAPTYTPGLDPQWDQAVAMDDVAAWVKTQGTTLMLIYGEYDPWSAGEFDLGSATDSYKLVVAGGNHGSRISLLAAADQALAVAALRRWAGVSSVAAKPVIVVDELPPVPRLRP